MNRAQAVACLSGCVIPLVSLPALGHGRSTQTAGCHKNSGKPGYHCHRNSVPRSSVRSKSTQSVSSAPSKVPLYPKAVLLPKPTKACIREDVLVRTEPNFQASVVRYLKKNQCVFAQTHAFTVTDNNQQWRRIRLSDGRDGYVIQGVLTLRK